MKYRVHSSHCSDSPTTEIWDCPSDLAALQRFETQVNHPSNAWDDMSIERIDVEEQTTHLAFGANLKKP